MGGAAFGPPCSFGEGDAYNICDLRVSGLALAGAFSVKWLCSGLLLVVLAWANVGHAGVGEWTGNVGVCSPSDTVYDYIDCVRGDVQSRNVSQCPAQAANISEPVLKADGKTYTVSFIVRRESHNNHGGQGPPFCAPGYVTLGSYLASYTLATACVAPQQFDLATSSCVVPPDPVEVDCSSLPSPEKQYVGSFAPDPTGQCLPVHDTNGVSGLCAFDYSGMVRAAGGGFSLVSPLYTASGSSCPAPVPPAEDLQETDSSKVCAVSSSGRVCVERKAAKNCGEVNGNRVCLDSVPSGQCVMFGNGDLACGATAAQPDNGDGETPAVPDKVIDSEKVAGETTTSVAVNYYNASTVSSSQNPVVGEASGSGSDTEGDGGGGAVSGGQSCDVEPSCQGDVIQCAILEQEWRTRCVEVLPESEVVDLVGGADGVADGGTVGVGGLGTDLFGSGGGGGCPAPVEFEFFGATHSISWSFFCDLAVLARPLIILLAFLQGAFIVFGGSKA